MSAEQWPQWKLLTGKRDINSLRTPWAPACANKPAFRAVPIGLSRQLRSWESSAVNKRR
jgi:hypothetical protein